MFDNFIKEFRKDFSVVLSAENPAYKKVDDLLEETSQAPNIVQAKARLSQHMTNLAKTIAEFQTDHIGGGAYAVFIDSLAEAPIWIYVFGVIYAFAFIFVIGYFIYRQWIFSFEDESKEMRYFA